MSDKIFWRNSPNALTQLQTPWEWEGGKTIQAKLFSKLQNESHAKRQNGEMRISQELSIWNFYETKIIIIIRDRIA